MVRRMGDPVGSTRRWQVLMNRFGENRSLTRRSRNQTGRLLKQFVAGAEKTPRRLQEFGDSSRPSDREILGAPGGVLALQDRESAPRLLLRSYSCAVT